ncbi:MAG: cupin domain-containing protein [Proteobacteria bacterium]|nr:cupin domain-containing protein [Pseudomonadota bacterium]
MTFRFLHSEPTGAPISIPAIGLDLRVRVPPEASGGTLTAIETTNQPGFGPPLHRHRETEIFHVLEGTYRFVVDGMQFEAATGAVVTAPGGSAHAFVNITDRPARQFILIVPGLDAEAFFSGLGAVMRDGRPDPARLNAFGAAWGVEFLGPPLAA